MEHANIWVIISGTLIGLSIYEFLLWSINTLTEELQKTKTQHELSDYLQHINSESVAKATVTKTKKIKKRKQRDGRRIRAR
jgi:hypothetical protein